MTVSTAISKALLDITGEAKPEIAIFEILKDAIEHRIEKIESEMASYANKYRMSFEEFRRSFESKDNPDSFSYKMESDFFEWEGLVARLSKYKSILSTLP